MMTFENLVRNNVQKKYFCEDCVPKKRLLIGGLLINTCYMDIMDACQICGESKRKRSMLSIERLVSKFNRKTEDFKKLFEKSNSGEFSAVEVINRSVFAGQEECFQQMANKVSSLILHEILDSQSDSEPFWDDSSKYKEVEYQPNDGDLFREWKKHEESLIKVNRYFNKQVGKYFSEILFEITDQGYGGCNLMAIKKHSGCFFRARSYETHDEFCRIKLNPSIELYAPKYTSNSPGRMNAQGVETLYLANSIKTARAEVGGGKCLVARFLIKKRLKILDFTKINNNLFKRISPLDGEYFSRQKYRQIILKIIPEMLALPGADLDYVMTQAFCNFIATWEGWGKIEVHGVAYKSAKSGIGGKNFVIFDPHNKISRGRFVLDSIYKDRSKKGIRIGSRFRLMVPGRTNSANVGYPLNIHRLHRALNRFNPKNEELPRSPRDGVQNRRSEAR